MKNRKCTKSWFKCSQSYKIIDGINWERSPLQQNNATPRNWVFPICFLTFHYEWKLANISFFLKDNFLSKIIFLGMESILVNYEIVSVHGFLINILYEMPCPIYSYKKDWIKARKSQPFVIISIDLHLNALGPRLNVFWWSVGIWLLAKGNLAGILHQTRIHASPNFISSIFIQLQLFKRLKLKDN